MKYTGSMRLFVARRGWAAECDVILVVRCWWEGQASVAAIRIRVGPILM